MPSQLLAMSDASRQLLNRAALDPSSSVVIEACAGSGKTWLLVSRIVRLLLDGAEPSQILAVTFTRKAAQEMAARLHEWLHLLATAPDAAVRDFLHQREVRPEDIEAMLPQARRLYEKLLTAQPSITITTFHSWFMQLLRRAPLDAGVPGDVTLVEQTAALVDEAWERFAGSLSRNPDAPAARGLTFLFQECGLENTRQLLTGFLRRRAEWWAYTRDAADPAAHALARIAQQMTVAPDADVAGILLADAGFVSMLEEYAALLGRNTATDQQLAEALQENPGAAGGRDRFENIRAVLFTTTEGTLKKRKPSAAQAKRLTPAGEVRFLELHAALGDRIEAVHDALRDQDSYRFNEAGLRCGAALLAAYQSLKLERQVIDYGDIEWRACELVRVSDHAAYMHCKLDARYRHILVDEFQDTNPLQWLTLQSWLEAAVDADSRPTVFMVGDPKQSIYRFRRAEARLFTLAQGYLGREFAAQRLAQNESRRCAQPVIDVVNQVFGAEPEYTGFAPHTAYHRQMPGRVEVLPLAVASAVPATLPATGLRNPLLSPLIVEEDRRRDDEAALLARKISMMVGQWMIDDGRGGRRPLRCADIMILVRRRTHLAVYERALRNAGIPFVTSRQGGLLDTLEAQDLIALLRFLSSPFSDLDLAHTLRSPLFAAGDDDLVAIAATSGGSWWQRLAQLVAQPSCSPDLLRAHKLLARWLARADAAPVHDQLDRIYFEGGLMHRYAQAVPVAMRGAVAANLQAFIQHALDADAGRYPSLPRFINELGDLRSAPVEEAPDEGIIGDAGDALRIHTVHGAKGLEAPVVWMLDTAAGQDAGRGYDALIDWPPEAERPLMFSLWTRKDAQSTAQRAQAQDEAALDAREDLNLLYVAMTRARQALIVSGVEGRSRNESWYARIRAAVCTAAGVTDVDPVSVAAHGVLTGGGGAVSAPATPVTVVATVDARLTQPLPTGRRITEPAGEGLRFGTLFHLLLERLTSVPPLTPPALQDAMGMTGAEFAPLWEVAQRLLKQPDLERFFHPGHYVRAMNEVACVDAAGAVRRIDRLVEFRDVLWVIDYKSGALPGDTALLAKYDAQLAGYRDAISAMYPRKPVRAMLIFSSGETRETAVA